MSAQSLFYIVLSYLIGSIPSGLIVAQRLTGRDIRTMGSGNIGATNVRRVAGLKAGLLVLTCDIVKGLAPILVVFACSRQHTVAAWPWTAGAVALAAVLGHIYPVFLNFKPSGKGVATALGAYLLLAPVACAIALSLFAALTAMTRKVSIGSMSAVSILPVAVWLTRYEPATTASAAACAVLILFRHKGNIRRLRQGKEPALTDAVTELPGDQAESSNKTPPSDDL